MWAGAIGNIPPGWHLCDGTTGTPDLRNKFEVATGPIFAVGDEGGNFTHTHDLTSDGHQHVIGSGTALSQFVTKPRTTNIMPEHATTSAKINQPPYYALAYIIYLGT